MVGLGPNAVTERVRAADSLHRAGHAAYLPDPCPCPGGEYA